MNGVIILGRRPSGYYRHETALAGNPPTPLHQTLLGATSPADNESSYLPEVGCDRF